MASTSTSTSDAASFKTTRFAYLIPKRPHSRNSTTSSTPTPPAATTPKRFKAALSVEAPRPKVKSLLSSSVPGSPKRSPFSDGRKTPDTKKKPGVTMEGSEMDVSRVNPEDVLVDYSNLELGDGDCSAEIDESLLGALNH